MNKILYVILMLLYKLSLEQLYINNWSNIYRYQGVLLDYNGYKIVASWIIFFILIAIILSFAKNDFWFIVIQLFSLFIIIPSISLYGLKNIPTIYFVYNLVFWSIFIIAAMFLSKVKFEEQSSNGRQKVYIHDTILIVIFIFSAIIVLVSSYLYGDFRVTIKFDDIYKYRLALREVNMPIFIRYMLPIMGTILLPICVMEYLSRRKYVFVGLTLLLGLMLFSINGMKTWLFVYFIVIFIYIITKQEYNNYTIINWILFIFVIASIGAYIASVYFENHVLSGTIYRMTSLVSEISYYFIDYIYDKEPLLLRGSVLRHFFDYPYSMHLDFEIGGLYFGNFEARANNGLLGDAYSNFKIFGVILYPCLYAFVFKMLQAVLYKYDYKTNYIIILILIWATMNASFFTWILTGGVLVVWLIYAFNTKISQRS